MANPGFPTGGTNPQGAPTYYPARGFTCCLQNQRLLLLRCTPWGMLKQLKCIPITKGKTERQEQCEFRESDQFLEQELGANLNILSVTRVLQGLIIFVTKRIHWIQYTMEGESPFSFLMLLLSFCSHSAYKQLCKVKQFTLFLSFTNLSHFWSFTIDTMGEQVLVWYPGADGFELINGTWHPQQYSMHNEHYRFSEQCMVKTHFLLENL